MLGRLFFWHMALSIREEESCKWSIPKKDRQALFYGENGKKNAIFGDLDVFLRAFKTLGRHFLLADGMKHAQGSVIKKADPKMRWASSFSRENVQKTPIYGAFEAP